MSGGNALSLYSMTDPVLLLEPGDERAQKIAKAMSSQTANDVLTLLGDGAKSLTDITEKLGIPLTTSKYHIENLLDAGLIFVVDTKYSVKGREIKLYSLTNQLVIVAPRHANVRSLLLKYASLFAVVIAGSLGITVIMPLFSGPITLAALPMAANQETGGIMAAKASYDTAMSSPAFTDPALAFFLGGIFVTVILILYEAYLWKTKKL
jgi:DNA-binding transcriptional ArsR family regulator